MVQETPAPGSAILHCQLLLLLLLVLLNWCPSDAQWTDDQSSKPSDNWQTMTISNFTVATNGPVNYQLRSFTIEDQVNREVTLLIQANNGPELIKDMKLCSNIAYSLDSRHIFIQSLNPRQFNAVGLYEPKVLHQTGDIVLGGRRSLAFDKVHQTLFFSNQSRIQAIDYCSEEGVPKPITVIYRGLLDVTIGHIAVDAGRKLLLWSESIDSDSHCRLMEASLEGQNLRQLYESNSSICTAMTVHVPSARLYWVARQTLWSLSYGNAGGGGGNARVILRNDNLITDSIQIDPNHRYLYWSSMQRKVVRLSLAEVASAFSAGQHSSEKEHKVQLISQLGGQHLLLVAFQVSETSVEADDRRCLPVCTQNRTTVSAASSFTTKSTSITSEDNNVLHFLASSPPPPSSPSTTKSLTWRSVWTWLCGYQFTEQRIVDLLATGVVVVVVYVTLELIRACCRRRPSY